MKHTRLMIAGGIALSLFIGIPALAQQVDAQTIEQLMARLQQLQAELAALKQNTSQESTAPQGDESSAWCYEFRRNFRTGDQGAEVAALQRALASEGFIIDEDEVDGKRFGDSTADAVTGFQQKYQSEVLAPSGLKYGTGYVGPATRKKLNALYVCGARPLPIAIFPPIAIERPVSNEPGVLPYVQNPSFELSQAVSEGRAWVRGGYFLDGRCALDIVDGVARTGARSAKISCPTENDAYWLQKVSVEPNTDYVLSGWIKTDNVSRSWQAYGAGANLSIFGTWTHSPALFGTNDWTQETVRFNSGASNVATIAIRIGIASGVTTGTAWFDDIKLERADGGVVTTPLPVSAHAPLDLNGDGVVDNYDANAMANVVAGSSSCPANKSCDLNSDGVINVFDILAFDFINIKQDLNGDGRIDRYDANLLANVLAKTSPCPVGKSCDINLDGDVNVFDLVLPDPYLALTVRHPRGGESFSAGSSQTVRWAGGKNNWRFNVLLNNANGITVRVLVRDVENSGFASWSVPSDLPAGNYSLRLACANCGGTTDKWFADSLSFVITNSQTQQPAITILTPNGGESVKQGASQLLSWKISGDTSGARYLYLWLERDGILLGRIDHGGVEGISPLLGSYNWGGYYFSSAGSRVAADLGEGYKVNAVVYGYSGGNYVDRELARDSSDGTFTLSPNTINTVLPPPTDTPQIMILAPAGGEELEALVPYKIRWNSQNLPDGTRVHVQIKKSGDRSYVATAGGNLNVLLGSIEWIPFETLIGESYVINVSCSAHNPVEYQVCNGWSALPFTVKQSSVTKPLPDIAVSNLVLQPPQPIVGQKAKFSFTIKNEGTLAGSIQWPIPQPAGGAVVNRQTNCPAVLEPAASCDLSFDVVFYQAGQSRLFASAGTLPGITESRLGNNSASIVFNVIISPSPPPSPTPSPAASCQRPYHVLASDGRCVWSCGVGTQPDGATNECKCQSGYTQTGTDSFGRRTCSVSSSSTASSTSPTASALEALRNALANLRDALIGFENR